MAPKWRLGLLLTFGKTFFPENFTSALVCERSLGRVQIGQCLPFKGTRSIDFVLDALLFACPSFRRAQIEQLIGLGLSDFPCVAVVCVHFSLEALHQVKSKVSSPATFLCFATPVPIRPASSQQTYNHCLRPPWPTGLLRLFFFSHSTESCPATLIGRELHFARANVLLLLKDKQLTCAHCKMPFFPLSSVATQK